MQMDMKYFLSGRFTIRKEKVYPFAVQTAVIQSCRQSLTFLEKAAAHGSIEFPKISRMLSGNNQ